jgi:hypothetical protein
MQYLTIWDLILTPVFLLILTAFGKKMRDKRYPPGHPLRRYFMPALNVKFGGAIFIALVYQFYYGGGDTFNFFYHTQVINSSLSDSFASWFKLMTRQSYTENPEIYQYAWRLEWYHDPSSYTVAVIAAIFGLFTGTTYMPIALLFAFFSFTGVWAMYRTFVNLYPKLHKELAFAFLFIPSTFVWGSAIFKDTICIFGLGWLTYTTFRIFVNRDFSLRNVVMLLLSFYLVYRTKVYILVAFLPAVSIWLLTTYSTHIKSIAMRIVTKVVFAAIAGAAFFFFARIFSAELQYYSLENIANTAATTRSWLTTASGDEGSAYDLGEFDPSIGGMLKKFPQAVVVTLFRPFPWEARKVIVMLSALEALVFVYFTYMAFKTNGLGRSLKLIGKDPNVLFFLVFSLIFAFAVGISSYNFGALSRYKIPCLPFYAGFLMVLLHHKKLESPFGPLQPKRPVKRPEWA